MPKSTSSLLITRGGNMDYQSCLKLCISNARAAGADGDIAIYRRYPAPSEEEWAECLQEVIDGGEDLQNPYHCMGRYELRLARRGIKTVLGAMVDELKAIATSAAVPQEHVADVIALWASSRSGNGPSGAV